VRAGLVVAVAHVLFKLASLLQAVVFARYVPAGPYEVIYAFAFESCVFTMFLIGEEVIGPSFLPVFMREMDAAGEPSAWRFANAILTIHLLIALVIVAVLMIFPEAAVRLLTAWGPDHSPDRYALATRSVRWIAPSLIGLSIASTTYVILNGYKRFFLAAFGDASWRLCVLLFVLVGMGLLGFGYRCIAFGLLAGSILKLVTHLFGLIREMRLFRLSCALRQPAVRLMFLLMLPLVAGIVFAKVRDVFNNVYILSWLDSDGLIQANSFGRKPLSTIGFLIPYALSIAMFPFLCELVDSRNMAAFGSILTRSGRMLLSVFIPLSLVAAVMAQPLVAFLFQGGEFGVEAVRRTTVSTACYILVLPAYSLEYLLMQAFFANRRMVAITVVGIVFSLASIIISYAGIVFFGARGLAALMVVALGYVLSRTLKTGTLMLLLRKTVPCFHTAETLAFLARTVCVGVVSAGITWVALRGMDCLGGAQPQRLVLLAELVVAGVVFLAMFMATSRLFRLAEPFEMFSWSLRWLRERKEKKQTPSPAG